MMTKERRVSAPAATMMTRMMDGPDPLSVPVSLTAFRQAP
jgi:hypothetical protein